MALYQGKNAIKADSRSRIGALQISEHQYPAADWVTDPTLEVALKNPYGGPGMEDVVVPMGRLVAVAEPVQVYTGKYKTTLTLANGSNAVVGVAPYNFVKDMSINDRFGGNKPAILTDQYIRLPYIPADADSALCPWGHVTGDGITVGHYLKSTAKGQFTKWDPLTDTLDQRVGQILEKDFNQEMMGFLKMAMWAESMKYDDELYQNFYKNAYGLDANGNPLVGGVQPSNATVNPYFRNLAQGPSSMDQWGYLSPYQQQFTGIPGLTDGAGRQLTRFTGKTLGAIPKGTLKDTVLVFQILDQAGGKMVDIINSTDEAKKFVLKVGGVAATTGYAINYKTGVVTYTVSEADAAAAAAADVAVTTDYCAYFYGTNSYIDFQGAIGVFNVLLKL